MGRRDWIVEGLIVILTLSAASISMARPEKGAWEVREAPMPSQRVEFTTSAVNGKIYAIGGVFWDQLPRNGKVFRTVEEYDPVTNRWQHRTGMRIARTGLSSNVVDGKIYAIGGHVQLWWWRKHVEVYDPVSDTWETKADMQEVRPTFSSSVSDGRIYVMGGAEDGSTEEYNPVVDRWERKAKMPGNRTRFATSSVDGKIYAIGGVKFNPEKYLDTVEVYNPATDTWEKRADMPTARCCLTAHTINGIIYAIGGGFGHGPLSTVEAYDPASDTWERMTDMPEARGGFSASVVDGKIYVFTDRLDFKPTVLVYTPPFRPPRSVNPMGKAATTWGRLKTER